MTENSQNWRKLISNGFVSYLDSSQILQTNVDLQHQLEPCYVTDLFH